MKKLFVMALLAVGMTAQAEDYKYLNVAVGGTEKSISLGTLQKITFENGNMVVATSNGTDTYVLTDLQKMYFSQTATSIEALKSEPQNATPGAVYDLSGRRVEKPVKGLYIVGGKKVVIK